MKSAAKVRKKMYMCKKSLLLLLLIKLDALLTVLYLTERTPRDDREKSSRNILQNFAQIFLGEWEALYNPNFNPLELEGIRTEAGLNAFAMSPTR